MKILAVQGSPRPKASNTEILLRQFLKGAESQSAQTETIYLKEKEIHPCQGCYTCWTRTPGVCVFNDDMPELLEKVKTCDVIVYATPLYIFNMTALLKAFQERLLPLLDPHLMRDGERHRHLSRGLEEKKMVLLSNCGFPEVSHFDALRKVFHHIELAGAMSLVGEILMPAGELLKQEALRPKTQPVLDAAYRGGVELVRDGRVSKETEVAIQAPVLSPDQMAAMANAFWDRFIKDESTANAVQPGNIADMRLLLHGMAASLNSQAAGDLKAVIQFHVTGGQPGNWFLIIEKGRCMVREGEDYAPTLTINTPSEIWLAIANKELDGQTAFMEGKYTVQGDIGLLMRLKSLFGGR